LSLREPEQAGPEQTGNADSLGLRYGRGRVDEAAGSQAVSARAELDHTVHSDGFHRRIVAQLLRQFQLLEQQVRDKVVGRRQGCGRKIMQFAVMHRESGHAVQAGPFIGQAGCIGTEDWHRHIVALLVSRPMVQAGRRPPAAASANG